MVRFFRPGRVVHSGRSVWLVDESWPVALAIGDDLSTHLLAWPWPLTRADPELDHAVVGDGVGIVVRDGEQLAWVRPDSTKLTSIDRDLTLAAADPDIAWLVDRSHIDPGHPPAPAPPLPAGRIVALHRDGSRTQVDTSRPINALAIRGADLWVTVAEPATSRPIGRRAWAFGYPRSVLRVPRGALLADGLADAVPATGDIPRTPHLRPRAWLVDEPAEILRCGLRAGGLAWSAGAPSGCDHIERRAVVAGHDPATGLPVVRVDTGSGLVGDVQAVGDELWLIVARRRYLAVPRDRGVDVLAVAASGAVRTIHRADSIDISRFAPVLRRPPPEQIREHIDNIRQRFDHLDTSWHSADGTARPLSLGLNDPWVTAEGEWPNARLIVTLRHQRRPGLMLRRILLLFDETGAPIDHQYADIHLMEDLDTDYLAPAGEAVDGVLDT